MKLIILSYAMCGTIFYSIYLIDIWSFSTTNLIIKAAVTYSLFCNVHNVVRLKKSNILIYDRFLYLNYGQRCIILLVSLFGVYFGLGQHIVVKWIFSTTFVCDFYYSFHYKPSKLFRQRIYIYFIVLNKFELDQFNT